MVQYAKGPLKNDQVPEERSTYTGTRQHTSSRPEHYLHQAIFFINYEGSK